MRAESAQLSSAVNVNLGGIQEIMGKIIGIDLGTTNSVVSLMEGGGQLSPLRPDRHLGCGGAEGLGAVPP